MLGGCENVTVLHGVERRLAFTIAKALLKEIIIDPLNGAANNNIVSKYFHKKTTLT